MNTVSSGTAGTPYSQDKTNNSVIRNSDLMKKFQIYVCVLVLFSYMIFWVLSKSLQGQIKIFGSKTTKKSKSGKVNND